MAEAVVETTSNKKKGMVLPFKPHSITFDDIRYSVDMPEVSSYHGNNIGNIGDCANNLKFDLSCLNWICRK